MEILQINTTWAVSDVLTLLAIIGSVVAAVVGWLITTEVRLSKLSSRIDANTEMDKTISENNNTKWGEVLSQLKDLTKEVHEIRDWITGQKAIQNELRNK